MPAALFHPRHEASYQSHHRADVLVVQRRPLGSAGFEPRFLRERAGIVDEDVDTAKSVVGHLGDTVGGRIRRQISQCHDGPPAGGDNRRRDAPGLRLAPAVDEHQGALGRE